jgi:hypothetical protein
MHSPKRCKGCSPLTNLEPAKSGRSAWHPTPPPSPPPTPQLLAQRIQLGGIVQGKERSPKQELDCLVHCLCRSETAVVS